MIARVPCRIAPRLFAGALGLVLAGGQAASAAHFALVRHSACLEHGLAAHGDAGSGHAHRSPTPAAGWTEGDRNLDHGHEHCSVVAIRRDTAGELGLCRSATPRPSPACSTAIPAFPAQVADDLWRVAPKQSPPSV